MESGNTKFPYIHNYWEVATNSANDEPCPYYDYHVHIYILIFGFTLGNSTGTTEVLNLSPHMTFVWLSI